MSFTHKCMKAGVWSLDHLDVELDTNRLWISASREGGRGDRVVVSRAVYEEPAPPPCLGTLRERAIHIYL